MTATEATILGVGIGAVLGWVGAIIQGRLQRGEGDRQRIEQTRLRRLDRLDEAYRIAQAFIGGWREYVQQTMGRMLFSFENQAEPSLPEHSNPSQVAPSELHSSELVKDLLADFSSAVNTFMISYGEYQRSSERGWDTAQTFFDNTNRVGNEVMRQADELLETMRTELGSIQTDPPAIKLWCRWPWTSG